MQAEWREARPNPCAGQSIPCPFDGYFDPVVKLAVRIGEMGDGRIQKALDGRSRALQFVRELAVR